MTLKFWSVLRLLLHGASIYCLTKNRPYIKYGKKMLNLVENTKVLLPIPQCGSQLTIKTQTVLAPPKIEIPKPSEKYEVNECITNS